MATLQRVREVVTRTLVWRSMKGAMALVGIAETFMAVVGISLADLLPESFGWPSRLLLFAVAFIILSGAVVAFSYLRNKDGLKVEVGGNDVEVKVGDLFVQGGLRVIPFDEWFDTQVDDKVISRNSLNGIFMEKYADLPSLKKVIDRRDKTSLPDPEKVGGRWRYPLGTIKAYDDYALLAFAHMDDLKRAHLSRGQYEECLLAMWVELNRVYAGRKVVLPLLGSGITRFEGGKPTEDELLQCMLCTLRASKLSFRDGVEIVLMRKTADRMRLYEVREYADGWKQGEGETDGI